MSVKIRLARTGTKHVPFYRIVAIHSRNKRDGRYLENLGTYNALTGELVQFHSERIDHWVSLGAQPSDTVKKLYHQHKQEQKAIPAAAEKTIAKKTAPKKGAAKKEEAASVERDTQA